MLSAVSWWACCISVTAPPHPTQLAMNTAQHTHLVTFPQAHICYFTHSHSCMSSTIGMHTSHVLCKNQCCLCNWAAAAATISVLLAVKVFCNWCESWQHHAICLSVMIVRGPHRAEHSEWKGPEQDDGFWACSFLFWCWGSRMMCIYQLQTTPVLQVCSAFCSNFTTSSVACTARSA